NVTRRAFAKMRLPAPGEWATLPDEQHTKTIPPLIDIEQTLDEIALAIPGRFDDSGESHAVSAEKRSLFLPDAFDNPEYVRFAIKGALAALICYVTFIGFDYPGIYTSVITCFVVALSTIGASNQKGILRFGGAAVGGLLGLAALMYVFPNVETIGGFLLVFGAGCAVTAWATVGSPRISYGGYQVGLAFWKATLQGFGMAMSAQVLRDRLIGVAFGLVVFGFVEHYLWPERAKDALRARLSEALRLLAELARARTKEGRDLTTADVDSWRRRISLKLEEVRGLIESSKFEHDARDIDALQKIPGAAQIAFVLLLSRARHPPHAATSAAVQARTIEADRAVAETLEAMAIRVTQSASATPDLRGALDSLVATLRPLSRGPL